MKPSAADPELLYRKPGPVTAAQVLLWIQFSVLVGLSALATAIAILVAGINAMLRDIFGRSADASDHMYDNLWILVAAIVIVLVLVLVLYAVLALKIGGGRRWAQITAAVLMLAVLVAELIGIAVGLDFTDGVDLGLVLVWVALPAATLICLSTGSANQWFRQNGRDSLRPPWPGHYQPYPVHRH